MFSVWAFSWAKWPQTADSTLASSIFGTYVRKVGEHFSFLVSSCLFSPFLSVYRKVGDCICAQRLLTVHCSTRCLNGRELHADLLHCCACQMQHVCLQQRNGQTPEVWLI